MECDIKINIIYGLNAMYNLCVTVLFKGLWKCLRVDENIHISPDIDTHIHIHIYDTNKWFHFVLYTYDRYKHTIFNALLKRERERETQLYFADIFSSFLFTWISFGEWVSFPVHGFFCFHYCLLLFYTLCFLLYHTWYSV